MEGLEYSGIRVVGGGGRVLGMGDFCFVVKGLLGVFMVGEGGGGGGRLKRGERLNLKLWFWGGGRGSRGVS